MPMDANFRRKQREAFEAVLKALSVVKLDWSKQKLLADLRKELNISQSTYVELLDKVVNDPEVRSSKNVSDVRGSLREALNEAGRHSQEPRRRAVYESDNETDTERDEDYRKDDDFDDEDSFSEGSTSRLTSHRRSARSKPNSRKRKLPTSRRKPKNRMTSQDSSGSRADLNPLSRDEVYQYELTNTAVLPGMSSSLDLSSLKPPYDKDIFEAYLSNGTLEELKEMSRQVKRRRQALINSMLDDEDLTDYQENDLVQKILLREKNARQVKALETELNLLNKGA